MNTRIVISARELCPGDVFMSGGRVNGRAVVAVLTRGGRVRVTLDNGVTRWGITATRRYEIQRTGGACIVCGRGHEYRARVGGHVITSPDTFTDFELSRALTHSDGRAFHAPRGAEFARVCDVCARAAFTVEWYARARGGA